MLLRLAARAALAAVLLSGAAAWGGAWSQPRDTAFFRLSGKTYFANQHFNGAGSRLPGDFWAGVGKFDELSFLLIAEYGVLDWLTLTAETTFKIMHSDYPPELADEPIDPLVDTRVIGFSDAIFGARWGFYQRSLVAALAAKLQVPTGYSREYSRVSLGNGEVAGHIVVLFGGGVPLPIGDYFDTSLGARIRSGGSADLLATASIGIEPIKQLWVRVGGSGTFNVGVTTPSNRGLPANASYVSMGGAVTYLFGSGIGIEAGASVDLWGKNTFAGWGVELVVQYTTPKFRG